MTTKTFTFRGHKGHTGSARRFVLARVVEVHDIKRGMSRDHVEIVRRSDHVSILRAVRARKVAPHHFGIIDTKTGEEIN